MNKLVLRPIDTAEPTALSALQADVFDDHERSEQLAAVVAAEAAARPEGVARDVLSPFGLAAYRAGVLIGWSQGHRQGKSEFYMLNSGVARSERRQGVYTELARGILAHATSGGYTKVTSRHAASNTAVLIAKLRLGFQVSGFEYSEVYGPLVQLTFLVHEARRRLYRQRSASIRTSSP